MSTAVKGFQGIRSIEAIDLKGLRVFLRVDFNVPTEVDAAGHVKISDDRRIRAALPTIQHILKEGGKLVLASHFGRPETSADRGRYSLEPIGQRLGELLGDIEVLLVDEPTSDAPRALFAGLKSNQVILLENLRFDPGETKNSRELAGKWAGFTDVYINDAFGASHRAHASIDALARMVAVKGVGFLIKREIEALTSLVTKPESPFLAILGGAKVSDKIPVIENLMDKVDSFIIGGAMAYTFLAAKQVPVGESRVEREQVNFAREMMARLAARKKRLLLPIDHVAARAFANAGGADNPVCEIADEGLPAGLMGLDIGPKSRAAFREEILRAKTVFWNGPMGVFENEKLKLGTVSVAESLATATERGAKTIVGGGDSAAAAEDSGFADKLWHISTGGGASLEFLQGDELPGLEALRSSR